MRTFNYTGTLVTRCRTTGHTDAFSFSGFTSWDGVVRELKSRVRNPNCELRSMVGVVIEDCKHVDTFAYNADELLELTGTGLLDVAQFRKR